MKKLNQLVFSIIIFLIFTSTIYSQSQFIWQALPNAPYTPGRFEDIFFIDANTGWIVRSVDSNGVKLPNIYKTTNGGDSWLDLSDTVIVQGARCIVFANPNTGWIGSISHSGGHIYKTTDGGESWVDQFTNLPPDTNYSVCGLYAVNENIVYGCGRWFGPAKFYKTTNGGQNWIVKDLSAYADRLIDVYFTSPDSGFVVGGIGPDIYTGNGVILFTSDGGESWETKFTTTNNRQWAWKIDFPTQSTGYVSLQKLDGAGAYIIKTTDAGQSWEEKTVLASSNLNQQGIGFINENTGWIGGWGLRSYITTNGGDNWTLQNWGYNINRFRLINDTLVYAVGQTVYKYMRDSTNSIQNISTQVPEKPFISQNYPNPFNPTTKIKFTVLDYENVKLTVFDVLGRELSVLVDGRFNPGYYEYTFDATELESGVYFYRIETFNYTETKKMILLK